VDASDSVAAATANIPTSASRYRQGGSDRISQPAGPANGSDAKLHGQGPRAEA